MKLFNQFFVQTMKWSSMLGGLLFISLVVQSGVHSAAPSAENRSLEDGLVVWLKLDEKVGSEAADSSQNENHGTLVGNPQWVDGKIEGGLALQNESTDDDNQWVEILPQVNQNMVDVVTLAAWVNADRFRNGDGVITKGQNITSYALRLWGDGKVMFTANFGEPFGFVGSGDWLSAGSIGVNVWHHIAVTYDGTQVRFYIDGVFDGNEIPVELVFGRATQPLFIGADFPDDNQYFDGRVDDIRVYNRALSAAEVATLAAFPNEPPTLDLPADQTSVAGERVSLEISATDPEDDALIFGARGLPPGLEMEGATGFISGVVEPGSAGSYLVEITVSDGANSVTGEFGWTIVAPTATSTSTSTFTPTSTATASPTVTDMATPTASFTATTAPATETPVPTPTSKPTDTATSTPTHTPQPSTTVPPATTDAPTQTPSPEPTADATATPEATPDGQVASLQTSQVYFLYRDADHDRFLSPGDIIMLQTQITNEGQEALKTLRISQIGSPQLSLVADSFWIIYHGSGSGEQLEGTTFPIEIASLGPAEEITVAYLMRLESINPEQEDEIQTQCQIEIEGYLPVTSELTRLVISQEAAGLADPMSKRVFLPFVVPE